MKRKRSSTWYWQLHKEVQNALKANVDPKASTESCSSNEDYTVNCPHNPHTSHNTINSISSPSKSSSKTNRLNISNRDQASDFLNSDDEMSLDSNNNVYEIIDATPRHSSLSDTGINSFVQQTIKNSDNIADKLRNWAITHQVTHSALKDLLFVLSNSLDENFQKLPKDPRTFLSTPRQTVIKNVDPGQYCHIGVRNGLEKQYSNLNIKPLTGISIKIGVNIDGVPLAKSSSSQLYPILGINKNIDVANNVFLIGVYHGYEKPKDFNNFLSQFVDKVTDLTTNGINLFGQFHEFKITMFLFDAVAKASVLNIKGHSGYHSCTKCSQEGEYVRDRVCFPDLTFVKRSHKDFVEQNDPDHHNGPTILANIPNIDLITDVPLDYMHLVNLGVVKKLLLLWCCGPPPNKFSALQINRVSTRLEEISSYVPSEFARKPRSLKEVKRWKATEFRQFLLYTGPIVLKDILSKQKYQHFLSLTVSISILISPKFCSTYVDYAETLLFFFVKTVKELYGPELITHNFHNLLHLADDCKTFGSLENFSNFSSENYLQSLLKLVRKHEKPLQQIIRRNHESNLNKFSSTTKDSGEFSLTQEHFGGILVDNCRPPEYKTAIFKNFKLSCCTKDSCCILKDKTIIEIKNFAFSVNLNQFVVIGQPYESKHDFFELPCTSSLIEIYFVAALGGINYWPITEINYKLVRLPYHSGFVAYPMLHIN